VSSGDEAAVRRLYEDLIAGWNAGDAERMAAPFTAGGAVIGYDGSEQTGRDAIEAEMRRIFADHGTAAYVTKVKSVSFPSADVGLLRAIVGMIPPGRSEIEPARNAHQTVVAVKQDDRWQIVLFQNTPAQFHGRPELLEQMTQELSEVPYGADSGASAGATATGSSPP
jgi:uncharacterized protein (TIGR02246 family)